MNVRPQLLVVYSTEEAGDGRGLMWDSTLYITNQIGDVPEIMS